MGRKQWVEISDRMLLLLLLIRSGMLADPWPAGHQAQGAVARHSHGRGRGKPKMLSHPTRTAGGVIGGGSGSQHCSLVGVHLVADLDFFLLVRRVLSEVVVIVVHHFVVAGIESGGRGGFIAQGLLVVLRGWRVILVAAAATAASVVLVAVLRLGLCLLGGLLTPFPFHPAVLEPNLNLEKQNIQLLDLKNISKRYSSWRLFPRKNSLSLLPAFLSSTIPWPLQTFSVWRGICSPWTVSPALAAADLWTLSWVAGSCPRECAGGHLKRKRKSGEGLKTKEGVKYPSAVEGNCLRRKHKLNCPRF